MTRTWLYAISLAVVAAVAVVLRVYDIAADLPAYFARGSQDLTTDAAYLTLYSKTAVQFGTWDLFGFEPWSAFKVSVISGVSYLFFLLFGVSRSTAAITGSCLQLVGLGFFVAGCARWLRRETVLFVAILLAVNYLLVLFGRVPFSENGLIFFAGLAFWVYAKWFDALWGKIAVGVLITAAALLGKSFGFLILGGPALYAILRYRRHSLKPLLLLVAPVVLLTLLYALSARGEGGLFAFLYEYGVGEHGLPHGLNSVRAFFESLVSVSRTGVHTYTAALSLMAWLVACMLIVERREERDPDRVVAYAVGWIVAWLVLLSPFNYQPVRYLYSLAIPLTLLVGAAIERWQASGFRPVRSWSWWRFAVLVPLHWYAAFSFAVGAFALTLRSDILLPYVWYCLPVALVLAAISTLIPRTLPARIPVARGLLLLAGVAALIVAVDVWRFFTWFPHRTHMIEEASDAIAEITNPGAVLCGQYGPAVAANTPYGSLRLFLRDDAEAFDIVAQHYPVTHLAVGRANFDASLTTSSVLSQSPILTTLWLRDNYVRIARINSATGNSAATAYAPTDFELAMDCLYRNDQVEGARLLSNFLAKHPRNKIALVEAYYLTVMTRNPRDAKAIVDTLYANYRSDYAISLLAAIYFKHLAAYTRNTEYGLHAQECLADAVWYGPDVREDTERMYKQYGPTDRIVR